MTPPGSRYALIIPALNEAESIGLLLSQIPAELFSQVIVVDNGSLDATAEVARAAGAKVVSEPRRGYGRACQAGLANLHPGVLGVAFMDADLADDTCDLAEIVRIFEAGSWDLVTGSRVLGGAERGSLTPLQRFGNWLATRLIRSLWHVPITDLRPLRIIRRESLGRLRPPHPGFGWNVEMQAKAAHFGPKGAGGPRRYPPRG